MDKYTAINRYYNTRKLSAKKLGENFLEVMLKERRITPDSKGNFDISKSKEEMKKEMSKLFEDFFVKDSEHLIKLLENIDIL